MSKNTRILIPLALTLTILLSCVGGWFWYDNNVDRSGWAEKNGVRYYRDFHADPVSGWLDLEEGRYYFHEDGTPHTGWQTIDGLTLYFAPSGILGSGWLEEGDDTYFLQENGTPALGWQEMEGYTYYFGDSGKMHTGWMELDGKTYYFGGNGIMVEGWLWLGADHYYLENGALLTGWQEIEGDTYYFNEAGIAAIGFADIDGSRYYFDGGVLLTGYQEIDGQDYYFLEDGTMFSGWEEHSDGKRYYLSDGTRVYGWQEIGGQRYYFNENGYMHTGWLQLGEYRYNLRSDGTPCTGPTWIGGELHYFSPKGIEVVLVNALNPMPSWYSRTLVNVTGYHDVDRRCYDALIQMLADCNAAGIEYTFNSAYRTIEEQTAIMEYRTREHMEDYDLEFRAARDKAMETVAIPSTSEHHLGLAVDLLGTEAVVWLQEHCWDYGFIVRYTEEKEPITGIVDEPWHFRYVGTEVSLDMKGSGLCLEEYLGAESVTMDKVHSLYGEALYQETIYGQEEAEETAETEAVG